MPLTGLSDLAIVQLKHVVQVGTYQPQNLCILKPEQEHADYELGDPISAIELATTSPEEGDQVKRSFTLTTAVTWKVVTAGWGLVGYQGGLSPELRMLQLTITKASCVPDNSEYLKDAKYMLKLYHRVNTRVNTSSSRFLGGEYVAVHRCLY